MDGLKGTGPMPVSLRPLIKPDERISRIICCALHLIRYVAMELMWRSGSRTKHSLVCLHF